MEIRTLTFYVEHYSCLLQFAPTPSSTPVLKIQIHHKFTSLIGAQKSQTIITVSTLNPKSYLSLTNSKVSTLTLKPSKLSLRGSGCDFWGIIPLHLCTCEPRKQVICSQVCWHDRHTVTVIHIPVQKAEIWMKKGAMSSNQFTKPARHPPLSFKV